MMFAEIGGTPKIWILAVKDCTLPSNAPFGCDFCSWNLELLEIGMVEVVVECQWLLRGNNARLFLRFFNRISRRKIYRSPSGTPKARPTSLAITLHGMAVCSASCRLK